MMKKMQTRKLEIEKLEKEKQQIESLIKIQRQLNIKNLSIKNLKIFGSVCNFIMPYILVSMVTVAGFKIFRGGYPIYKDSIVKKKFIHLHIKLMKKLVR